MYDARTENASPIPILNVYQLARPCDRALWPLCRPLAASRPARGQSGSRSRAHVPLCGMIGPVRRCWSVSCSVSVQSVSKNDFRTTSPPAQFSLAPPAVPRAKFCTTSHRRRPALDAVADWRPSEHAWPSVRSVRALQDAGGGLASVTTAASATVVLRTCGTTSGNAGTRSRRARHA